MSRDLSTKGLASRLNAEYSAKKPFRRRIFTATALLVVVLGAIVALLSIKAEPHALLQPGKVAAVHRTVANQCNACHDDFKSTPESKCQVCHTTPGHNMASNDKLKLKVPACYECHLEHRSGTRAPPPSDSRCAQCHHNLKKNNSSEPLLFQDGITSFVGPHPEIAIMRTPDQDPAQVKFNHKFHLDKATREARISGDQWTGLVGQFLKDNGIDRPEAERTDLSCTDCHMMDGSGKLMQPVKYAKNCQTCHALKYDLEQRATGASTPDRLPHDQPDVIHRHLVAQFTLQRQRIDAAATDRKLTPAALRAASDWVNNRVDGVENTLVSSGKCSQCHVIETKPDAPGQTLASKMTVAPTDIRSKWFTHAQFSHVQHRTMACESCHSTVRNSTETKEVNLPKLKDCQSCHSPQAGARSDCVECHMYHDEKDRVRNQGKIRELPGGAGR